MAHGVAGLESKHRDTDVDPGEWPIADVTVSGQEGYIMSQDAEKGAGTKFRQAIVLKGTRIWPPYGPSTWKQKPHLWMTFHVQTTANTATLESLPFLLPSLSLLAAAAPSKAEPRICRRGCGARQALSNISLPSRSFSGTPGESLPWVLVHPSPPCLSGTCLFPWFCCC